MWQFRLNKQKKRKFYTGHETNHRVKFRKMAVTFEPMQL